MSKGPIPKRDRERSRRNVSDRFTPAAGGVPPPSARGLHSWPRAAREWWNAVKNGSAARSYSESDWQVALRGAQLVADYEKLRDKLEFVQAKSLMTELRQIEDRLMLTVTARRRARLSEDDASPDSSQTVDDRGELVGYRQKLEEKHSKAQ